MIEKSFKPKTETGKQEARHAAVPKGNTEKLKIHYKHPIAGKACPNCGAAMAENAVLCISCGYNTETGSMTELVKPQQEKRPKQHKWYCRLIALGVNALVLFLLILIAYCYIYYEGLRVKYAELLPVGLPVRFWRPVYPKWLQDITYHHLENCCRTAVRAEINQDYPLFEKGTKITIQTQSGQNKTGRYFGIKNGRVLLVNKNGSIAYIPVHTLNLESRLRCDSEGREKYIMRKAQERAKKIMGISATL